jgi:sporulation protein YlmC with PRC-barrel domain
MRFSFLGPAVLSAAIVAGGTQSAEVAFPDPRHVYETGVSAQDFVSDRIVYGGLGEQIGRVADLMVDPHGRIRSLLVRTSGFLGWGERLVPVPFDEVEGGIIGSNPEIRVPITADEINGIGSLFGLADRRTGRDGDGPLAQLMPGIGHDIRADETGEVLAYVGDFVLSGDSVSAVVVLPAGNAGFVKARLLPFTGLGPEWKPEKGLFRPSLTLAEIRQLPPFDRRRLQPVDRN